MNSKIFDDNLHVERCFFLLEIRIIEQININNLTNIFLNTRTNIEKIFFVSQISQIFILTIIINNSIQQNHEFQRINIKLSNNINQKKIVKISKI